MKHWVVKGTLIFFFDPGNDQVNQNVYNHKLVILLSGPALWHRGPKAAF